MSKTLKGKKLAELYSLLSVPMLDFNCGELCAPRNDGVPFCCDQELTVPLLYRDELRWHRKQSDFWRPMPCRTKHDKRLAREMCDAMEVLAVCPGAEACDRDRRALVCRTFPLEPHLDRLGRIRGLTYNFDKHHAHCPLIGRSDSIYNPEYVRNSIRFWKELFKLVPHEKDVYLRASKKLRKKFGEKGRTIPVFR